MGQLIYNLGNKQWDIPKLRALLETILPQKTTFDNYEVEHDFATIGKRTMLLNARQINRVLGKERIILLAIEDITEPKKTEKALLELEGEYHLLMDKALMISEQTFRLVVESLIVGIAVTDLKGVILQANKSMVLLHGFHKKEEIIGINSIELVDKIDRARIVDKLNEIKETGYFKDVEFTLLRADGTNLAAELTASLIKDTSGAPQGIVFLTRDITERKQAEKILRQKESKYRELTESISDVFFAMDRDLRYTYWNKASEKLTGVSAAEAIERHFSDIFPENKATRSLEDRYREAIVTQQPLHFTSEYPGDQNLIHEISVYPSADGISVFFKDVTESKHIEEELKQSNKALLKVTQDTIQAMAATCEMRDPYTAGHQQKVAKLTVAIAEEMHLSDNETLGLRVAALIHDIGKMSVPAEILSKPGKLSPIEFNLIKMHVASGYNILQLIDFPWPVSQIVYQHHERMDGSGYPNALKGDDIRIEARILIIADVIEAMTSHRPYRPALGIDKALEEISQNRGKLYDPEVVDACLKVFRDKSFKFE